MAQGWVHTVHRDGRWLNETEGGGVISAHRTKDEAAEAGRDLALERRTEHVIHNMDGTIGHRNSYEHDSAPPVG